MRLGSTGIDQKGKRTLGMDNRVVREGGIRGPNSKRKIQ